MPKEYDDKQFTKDFTELTSLLTQKLNEASTTEEAQDALDKLEGLATNPNSPATAKTVFGCAYLRDDKPWYDFKKGFEWVQKGADEAADNEAFCWFILGTIYLNGKPELPQDMVSAKYWICKAADAGYQEAQFIKELRWGEHPDGFREWFVGNIERLERRRRTLKIIALVGLILVIGVLVYTVLR